MRTEHLSYLLAIVQYGSINKASQALHISQQQLSKIVRNLESEFGAAIFFRNQSGSLLTADGELIVAQIKRLLDELDSLIASFHAHIPAPEQPGHDIFFHAISCLNLDRTTSILDDFSQKYPGLTLHIDEKSPQAIIQLITDHPEHIGSIIQFRSLTQLNPQIPECLKFIPVFTSSFGVYGAKTHPLLTSHKSLSLTHLLQTPILIYNPHSDDKTPIHDILSLAGRTQQLSSVSNISSFFTILHKGKHISLGIKQFQKQLLAKNPHLSFIPLREKTQVICGLLIHREARELAFIQTFINYYMAHFK